MKGKLEFDLDEPSDRLAHKRCVSATDAYIALHEIANKVFRPARKHGYDDKRLNELMETSREIIDKDGCETRLGYEIISVLEDRFYKILEEYNVNLDDLE